MAHAADGMDRALITGDDRGFVSEFLSESDCITAHTSGSTGKPKEIRLLKADMIASATATCRFFGITQRSRLVCPLSTDYIAGKMMVVRSLVSGARLEMLHPDISPLSGWNGHHCIDLLPVVPSQIESLLDDRRVSQVANLLVGGGALSDRLSNRLDKAGVKTWVSYGMTETCSHVALRRSGCDIYSALPGVTFSNDERGCLVIDIPEMSVKRVVTNDMAEIVSGTQFRWRGRIDNVINSGGVKIHPEEDERLLAPVLGENTRFYITSRPSARWGEEAVMIVIDTDLSDTEITNACRRTLPTWHIPKAIIHDMSPAFTSSGKLIRRKL